MQEKKLDKIEADISGLTSMFKVMIEKFEKFEGKLDTLDSKVDKLEQSQNSLKAELKKDIKDLSGMVQTIGSNLDFEIAGIGKKLDRQIASSRSNSAKFRELEMRIEDLEVSPPIK